MSPWSDSTRLGGSCLFGFGEEMSAGSRGRLTWPACTGAVGPGGLAFSGVLPGLPFGVGRVAPSLPSAPLVRGFPLERGVPFPMGLAEGLFPFPLPSGSLLDFPFG
jgi:hypothetical protein